MKTRFLKNIVTLLIFSCTITISYSQEGKSQDFWSKARLNVGITLGNYSFDSDTQNFDIKYDYSIGFLIGLDYEIYTINDELSIKTGFALSNHNSSIDQPNLGLKIDYSTYWIGTHAQVNYKIIPHKLSASLGVFADYGITGTQQYEGRDKIDVFTGKGENDAPFNSFNFGIISEVSYLMSWTDFADDIYISYRLGLANLEGADSDTQTLKTGMILLGFRANLDNLF